MQTITRQKRSPVYISVYLKYNILSMTFLFIDFMKIRNHPDKGGKYLQNGEILTQQPLFLLHPIAFVMLHRPLSVSRK